MLEVKLQKVKSQNAYLSNLQICIISLNVSNRIFKKFDKKSENSTRRKAEIYKEYL